MDNVTTTATFYAAAQHIAAQHIRCDNSVLCLTAHEGDAALLKQQLIVKDGLLPPIITLHQLAAADPKNIITTARVITRRAKQAFLIHHIHSLLCENLSHLSVAAAWSLAKNIAELFCEFIDEYPRLSVPQEAFLEQCKKMPATYQAESEIMAVLWELLYDGQLLADRRNLAMFVRRHTSLASEIIFVASGVEELSPWQKDFLQQCSARIFAPNPNDSADNAISNPIQQLWQGSSASLSHAAKMALTAIHQIDADSIGIVVYDRLLARRLRALAENDGILIEDTGLWRMETLSFGAALQQWNDIVCQEFDANTFGHLLLPPYWINNPQQRAAEYQWRKWITSDKILPDSWDTCAKCDDIHDMPWSIVAHRVIKSRQKMPQNAPLPKWIIWLLRESSTALTAWRHDATATRLRAILAAQRDNRPLTAEEFCQWLQVFSQTVTGGVQKIKSRVSFIPPSTTRQFDALILLGGNHQTLPSPLSSLLSDKGRQWLNLPDRDRHITRQQTEFFHLIKKHSKIAAVWTSADNKGADIPPSPFWTLITDNAAHVHPIIVADIRTPSTVRPPLPASGRLHAWPKTLYITAGKRLMQCPYHFFAMDILRLNETHETPDFTPAKQGILLHRLMAKFSQTNQSPADEDQLLKNWHDICDAHRPARLGAKMTLLHWRAQGDILIKKEIAHRAQEWQQRTQEHSVESTLTLTHGTLSIHGRLDRADTRQLHDGEQWMIIDYKSGGALTQKSIRLGEDPQLPLYAFFMNQLNAIWHIRYPLKTTSSLNITDGNTIRIVARLRSVIRAIDRGARMPANGAQNICQHCSSRRLCRRDHWQIK